MNDFDLSSKDAVVSVSVTFSIKHKSNKGTSENLHLFLSDLNEIINKHSSENIHFKNSVGNILTHKEKTK